MTTSPETLTVLELGEHLLGFYDGRVAGARAFSPDPNWLDDGGYALGICSYAIYAKDEAIVYDTHLSAAHGEAIRAALAARGVTRIRVVLSHWHLDHVAGNGAFADCEIIAHEKTLAILTRHKAAIENGTLDGPPCISPLILPTTTFSGELSLVVGGVRVDLRPLDIHSCDGVAAYLPHDGTLLAGDTLEDTITYVDEPARLAHHLRDLARLDTWSFSRILPNHGSKEKIAGGGYDRSLIRATDDYVRRLCLAARDESLQRLDLKAFIEVPLREAWVTYFEPYEAVHRANILKVAAALG
jgi:glyoxylase-like metal-dependent hydrolase (beta-lactamase superfamily II)